MALLDSQSSDAPAAGPAPEAMETKPQPVKLSEPLPARIDKTVLPIAEPRRLRDKIHLKWISMRPCLVCGRQPSDPHHLRFAQPRALGRKVSDEFTVPLCRSHHREVHRSSDEAAWWERIGIDALALAYKFW
jgi:hypothetical protein